MNQFRETPITFNNQEAVIIHNRLCADGPVDPNTKEPLLDSQGFEFPGLNDDVCALLHDYLEYFRGVNSKAAPRFGLSTLIAQETPIFLFDHPALFELSSSPIITDGINVYISAPFFTELVSIEKNNHDNINPLAPTIVTSVLITAIKNKVEYVTNNEFPLSALEQSILDKAEPFVKDFFMCIGKLVHCVTPENFVSILEKEGLHDVVRYIYSDKSFENMKEKNLSSILSLINNSGLFKNTNSQAASFANDFMHNGIPTHYEVQDYIKRPCHEQTLFYFEFSRACADYAIKEIAANPTDSNLFTKNIQMFAQSILNSNLDDSIFTHAIAYLKHKMANEIPEFSNKVMQKCSLNNEIREKIAHIISSEPAATKSKRDLLIKEITDYNDEIFHKSYFADFLNKNYNSTNKNKIK